MSVIGILKCRLRIPSMNGLNGAERSSIPAMSLDQLSFLIPDASKINVISAELGYITYSNARFAFHDFIKLVS